MTENVLSLSPLSLLPASPLAIIEAAATAGFGHLGLRFIPGMEGDADVLADPALMRAITTSLHETNLQLLDVEVIRAAPDLDPDAYLPLFEFAGSLGGRNVLVTATSGAIRTPEDEAQIVRALARLADNAARFGIRPMLEFMVYRDIASLQDAVRIATAVGVERFGICIDALHLSRSHGTPLEVADIDPALIACVQLCDAPGEIPDCTGLPIEARYERLLPGHGALPLADLVAATPAGVPFSVEVPRRDWGGLDLTDRARMLYASARALLR
ncbi:MULTISPECIES: sugar phosphate isomerase/epimerase [unclassified Microbacterium]|uniref:sugar phosphate isomerase/epimerase family protein n=1 Tax=unclassified Microbacterium TaxID=2609290 RepID=UPI00214CAA1F|nr:MULTISPECIES: sugar phosphate isomerase/epimerase [unclassified Microbacterium]MCR2811396.1 sugar phosphate isomerase/epimerase [Microbacterium sp. zg.B185]WIM19558.1 sugar phosphate isomerase/epimerase [Microbacterium sp. zg-B185]